MDLTVWALRRRGSNLIDRWDGRVYGRIIPLDNVPFKVLVTSGKVSGKPIVVATLQAESISEAQQVKKIRATLQQMLGLDADMKPFYKLAEKDKQLRPLVERYRGVRPPRFPTVFEALINSIACQQVTLSLGILLLNRLAESFGLKFKENGTTWHAFPRPEDLAAASEADLRSLGFSRQKIRAIKELSTSLVENRLDLTGLETRPDEEAMERLLSLRGIGRWSAEYVLLRGLGRVDTFPGDDVGAQNNLQRLFSLDERPNYDEIKKLTSRWHPYEGLVYFHLLLDRLHEKGVV